MKPSRLRKPLCESTRDSYRWLLGQTAGQVLRGKLVWSIQLENSYSFLIVMTCFFPANYGYK